MFIQLVLQLEVELLTCTKLGTLGGGRNQSETHSSNIRIAGTLWEI
jgi:hypothetical protein